jgi:hypothetical protein
MERWFGTSVTSAEKMRSTVTALSSDVNSSIDFVRVGGLGRSGDLHRRLLQHHLAVVVDIADHGPQSELKQTMERWFGTSVTSAEKMRSTVTALSSDVNSSMVWVAAAISIAVCSSTTSRLSLI